MEHIMQIGINIDDTAIKKVTENNIMAQIAENITNDCEYRHRLNEMQYINIRRFIEENRKRNN